VTGRILSGARAIFFDAVGTLLFPCPSAPHVYAQVACRNGLLLSEEVIRRRFREAYRQQEEIDRLSGWVTSEQRERDRWQAIVGATLDGVADPQACFAELYEHFSRPEAWRLHPEAADVLARLREQGYTLGLGSNYDSRLRRVLDGYPELAPLRERAVISSAVGFRKPAAEFFHEVVRQAGSSPAEVVFVGDDAVNDYHGACTAGLKAVLLGPITPTEPNSARPPLRIGTLRELLER